MRPSRPSATGSRARPRPRSRRSRAPSRRTSGRRGSRWCSRRRVKPWTAIVPLREGRLLTAESLAELSAAGQADEEIEAWTAARKEFAERLGEISRAVQEKRVESDRRCSSSSRRRLAACSQARRDRSAASTTPRRWKLPRRPRRGRAREPGRPAPRQLRPHLHVRRQHRARGQRTDRSPVVVETTPSLVKLLGSVETGWTPQGPVRGDCNIGAGSLLRATVVIW